MTPAIEIDDLRLNNSDISNPPQPEMKVSTKPVMDNYQSWEKSPFSKVESSVKSLFFEYPVKSSDIQMQIVEVTSQATSLLVKISVVALKCRVNGAEVCMK